MKKEETLDDILADEKEPVAEDLDTDLEPEPEPEPAATAPETPQDEPEADPEPDPTPRKEDGLQAALTESRAETRALKEQMAALQAQIAQAAQPQPEPPKPFELPDPMADQAAYDQALLQHMEQRERNLIANFSERQARRAHGTETVDKAFEAARASGMLPHFQKSADPWGDCVDWFKEREELETIRSAGGVQAFREQIRKELEAQMRADAVVDQIAPSAPSLAGETDQGRRSPLQQKHVEESLKDILGNPHDV